jgi:hypothetical protein
VSFDAAAQRFMLLGAVSLAGGKRHTTPSWAIWLR